MINHVVWKSLLANSYDQPILFMGTNNKPMLTMGTNHRPASFMEEMFAGKKLLAKPHDLS